MTENTTREPISAKETMRQRRLQKLTELMDKGINPYPYSYKKDISAIWEEGTEPLYRAEHPEKRNA